LFGPCVKKSPIAALGAWDRVLGLMQSRQKAVETGIDQLAGGADAPVRDDYSGNFAVVRTKLIGAGGTRYIEFVRGLKPNYRVVYRDIAVGYVCLLMSLLLTELLIHLGVSVWLMVPVGAILIGYWFAYLQLFIHEGAHYGLAPDKEHSDRLCDLLISVMIGTSVAAYRPIHFQHHRNLGTVQDSEFTYFFPLNLLFVVKGMFGIRAIEVILSREARSKPSNGTGFATGALVRIAAGAALHVVVVGTLVLLGFWAAALAWIVGVALVFPFFGALRQLL
jgi:fatty acid desaturase